MHILSTFPSLFTFSLLAPLLLRIALGINIISIGRSTWTHIKLPYKYSAIAYYIFGIFLILGLYTQISAIVGLIIVCFDYYLSLKLGTHTHPEKMYYSLMIIVLISLIFTGPGFFAIDWPL